MKRNLYSGSHRRSGPEAGAPQGWTGPSRPAPSRHRPQRNGGLPRDDGDLRSQAFDFITAATSDIDADRRQKSELKRLREEVLDIARELKGLQRGEPGRSGAADIARETASGAKPSAMSRSRKFAASTQQKKRAPSAVDNAQSDMALMFGGQPREFGRRPAEPRPPVPGTKRPPPIEPAQQNLRAGIADPATKAAPARAKAAPPAIRPGESPRQAPARPKNPAKPSSRRVSLGARAALLAVVMLAGTGLITMKLWGEMPWLAPARQKVADMLVHVSWPVSKTKAMQQADSDLTASIRQTSSTIPFAAPDTYGVYAVSDGQLTPLEPLPIRVPDARVSISSTISKPAPAPVANGHLSFVVYHRELATSVPESASVRIVAKVMQATAFAGGKPKSIAIEDTWAVRGGAVDLRIAPVPANHEMIVIRPADPNFKLSPGRYVLMFKNQAYDFSVAGTVSDTAQCLERSDLQDRSVFSECRELPAQPVTF